MSAVKFETITYHELWYYDLQNAMQDIYGIELEIAAMLDYPAQDTYQTYTVDGDSEFDSTDDYDMYREWLETGVMTDLGPYPIKYSNETHYYHGAIGVNHVLHRLYQDGHIPSGRYLLTIYW